MHHNLFYARVQRLKDFWMLPLVLFAWQCLLLASLQFFLRHLHRAPELRRAPPPEQSLSAALERQVESLPDLSTRSSTSTAKARAAAISGTYL